MEFNFANQLDWFILRELIVAKLDFPRRKHWKSKLKSLLCYNQQKLNKKIWKQCFPGINFRESTMVNFSQEFTFTNLEVIREIREIFWTRNFLTLRSERFLKNINSSTKIYRISRLNKQYRKFSSDLQILCLPLIWNLIFSCSGFSHTKR